jgi:hypothetical protein
MYPPFSMNAKARTAAALCHSSGRHITSTPISPKSGKNTAFYVLTAAATAFFYQKNGLSLPAMVVY